MIHVKKRFTKLIGLGLKVMFNQCPLVKMVGQLLLGALPVLLRRHITCTVNDRVSPKRYAVNFHYLPASLSRGTRPNWSIPRKKFRDHESTRYDKPSEWYAKDVSKLSHEVQEASAPITFSNKSSFL